MGVIYKRTNKINGMVYIGQTINDVYERWRNENNSTQAIGKAVREYGAENFKNEIIDIADTREELNEKEKYWIKYYDSQNLEKGYNKTKGGAGGKSGRYHNVVIWESRKMLFPTKVSLIRYLTSIQNEYTYNQISRFVNIALRLGYCEINLKNQSNIKLDLYNTKNYNNSIKDLTEYYES